MSVQLMQVATTSASALAAGQAIASYPAGQRDGALFLLVVLTGIFLAVFGLLRPGRLVRYVSHAVMTGFLIGVAVVLILDQLAPLVGVSPEGANEVVQFVDLLGSIGEFDTRAIVISASTLGIMIVLARTRLADLSNLVALVVPTVLMVFLGWEADRRRRSMGARGDLRRNPRALGPDGRRDRLGIDNRGVRGVVGERRGRAGARVS